MHVCYLLGASFTAGRPQVHVDATVMETPSITGGVDAADAHTWTIHIGNSFTDVPRSYLFYTYIERLVHNEVTFGTGGGHYSPDDATPRRQMAAFLARSAAGGDANVPVSGTISSAENPVVNGAYNCTGGGTSLYNDVLPTDPFCKYVHAITKANITNGCDATLNYCQLTHVTRAVMSIFVARAIVKPDGDALVPDANVGTGAFSTRSYDCTTGPAPFTDVTLGTFGCKHIGFIWTLGIVDGNGDGTFSPNANVSRGQMAVPRQCVQPVDQRSLNVLKSRRAPFLGAPFYCATWWAYARIVAPMPKPAPQSQVHRWVARDGRESWFNLSGNRRAEFLRDAARRTATSGARMLARAIVRRRAGRSRLSDTCRQRREVFP
jgi:hypothetical protein